MNKQEHVFSRWLLYILTSLMLTACGSGGDDELSLQPTTPTTPPPSVSSPAFRISTPTASAELEVNTNHTVTLIWQDATGTPKAGETVYFTSTRGTLSAPSAVTNASGEASITVSSATAGQAAIKASNANSSLSATLGVLFVSKTPSSISVQAESTSLVPNKATTITATVRDNSGNPVKGKVVEFTLVTDSSIGMLSDATAITDASGKASVIFTAGPETTGTNGVEIQARVQGVAPAITTNSISSGTAPLNAGITVGGAALFIALTETNTIESLDTTRYALPLGIQVTDSSGNPVSSKVISLSVIPTGYYKGQYVAVDGKWAAGYSVTDGIGNPLACENEDANQNGILDAGEDLNGNALLDPGLPVSVSESSVTTDNNGLASFSLVYGKNFANWVKVRLKATTSVSGSESVAQRSIWIPAMSTDVNSTEKSPPGGGPSPFGTANACTNPL